MALRLTDLIDLHEDFIDPESVDHLLKRFQEIRDCDDESAVTPWHLQENDYMIRARPGESTAFALQESLQGSVQSILSDFYSHTSVMSPQAFSPGNMCQVDPYNITFNLIRSGKTFLESVCSANTPAFFHHQLTGRVILSNPGKRRMNFFFDPNTHNENLPVGALSIHPSNMLYAHRPDTREGELIYLEFHLCPPLQGERLG